MAQTFTTRLTAIVLAAAIVTAAWLPTIAVPIVVDGPAIAATI